MSFSRTISLGFLSLGALAGCGSSDEGGATSGGSGSQEAPLFAVASTVSTADSSLTYVNLLSDLGAQTLDYGAAIEYPGWTSVLGVDGKLYVADGEAPTVERLAIDDAHRVTSEGKIGFSSYTDSVAFFSHIHVGPERGYFELGIGGVELLAWNPREMTIDGVVEAPAGIPDKVDGLGVYGSYDRGVVIRDGTVFQPVYWVDDDFYNFAPTSDIALYDSTTDKATGLLEAPCTNIDIATADESGNLYFSNWVYSAAKPLFDDTAPEPCMAVIPAGSNEVDPARTVHFPELTGGRQAAAFRYLANGKGLLTVFHDEDMDPEALPTDAVFSTHWKFWLLDLATSTAAPLDDLGFVAPGYYLFKLDGRTILSVPNEDLSESKVYEVSNDGAVTELFTTQGWAYQVVQVR